MEHAFCRNCKEHASSNLTAYPSRREVFGRKEYFYRMSKSYFLFSLATKFDKFNKNKDIANLNQYLLNKYSCDMLLHSCYANVAD